MIRKAEAKDKNELAQLCYIIWEELEIPLVENINKTRLLKVIERSMVDVPYRGHIDNIWVYEIDGAVAGCLIAYPGNKELQFENAWLELELDEDILKFGTPMPTKEAKDDEWYIETVATFPKYRRRGVATQLIEYVISTSPNQKWSLNCDINNEVALRVYKKLGFESINQIDLYGHMHHHMIYTKK
ncbi:GNAT family N-acetyltransferase [Staphylococcus sp. ACRSN]|uniref:GNAT family N-acetyltransferase n=1 Tax=Staphylococcus sp. ACRSN TaxID=2918214 RepID=UPI001EF2D15B|nr:GNAT family N-acetyltransferase [Staphylococcus sp. ACRSN]MCG7339357.1 GNAT family N-acetyltransferase [Staphylococcus sp. ACRSN]